MNVVQFVPKLKVAKRRLPPPLPTLAELLASREKVRARNSARARLAWQTRKQTASKNGGPHA
jgi:hypothetical protein